MVCTKAELLCHRIIFIPSNYGYVAYFVLKPFTYIYITEKDFNHSYEIGDPDLK